MKHDSAHKLDLMCRDCVTKHIEHNVKLLDFIEDLSNQYCSSEHVDIWAKKADKILKEIEADNE